MKDKSDSEEPMEMASLKVILDNIKEVLGIIWDMAMVNKWLRIYYFMEYFSMERGNKDC